MEQNIKVTITVDNVFKTAFYALGIYSTIKFISKLSKAYKLALDEYKKNKSILDNGDPFVTNFKKSTNNEGE